MDPAWRSARPVLRLLRGMTLLLLLCPPATRSDCSPPPDMPNAQLALQGPTSFPEGSVVTYQCNKGFAKIPGKIASITCFQDGWSQIAEFCNRSCDVPTGLPFAALKQPYNKQNFFPEGSVVEYECRKGYNTKHSLSGKATCLQNFTWSKPDEFCEKKSCPNPGEVINGYVNITTDILFGASILFSCNTGYKLVGATSSYCMVMGKTVDWSDPLPECQEIPQITKVTPTSLKPTTVNIPGTEALSTLQKPTTVNIPGTEVLSAPQKPITVNITGTEALSTPQKPITVNIPAIEVPSASQKPFTVNIPGTEALSTPQKPTTVNIPATEVPSAPQKPTTVHAPATKSPLIPQKPTIVNVAATEASSTPRKSITASDSATIAKTSPVSKVLSTETPPALQTHIIANISAAQVTETQKFTALHDLVSKDLLTTKRLTSAHITATQSPAVTVRTKLFIPTKTSDSRTLPAGVNTIASGLVAGTIIIGTLILVKIFWDYGKSGTHIYNVDRFAYDANKHWLADLAKEDKEESTHKYTEYF